MIKTIGLMLRRKSIAVVFALSVLSIGIGHMVHAQGFATGNYYCQVNQSVYEFTASEQVCQNLKSSVIACLVNGSTRYVYSQQECQKLKKGIEQATVNFHPDPSGNQTSQTIYLQGYDNTANHSNADGYQYYPNGNYPTSVPREYSVQVDGLHGIETQHKIEQFPDLAAEYGLQPGMAMACTGGGGTSNCGAPNANITAFQLAYKHLIQGAGNARDFRCTQTITVSKFQGYDCEEVCHFEGTPDEFCHDHCTPIYEDVEKTIQVPCCAPNEGNSCSRSGPCDTNYGSITCSGTCDADEPSPPAGYGSGCHGPENICGMYKAGIIGCSGVCPVTDTLPDTACPGPNQPIVNPGTTDTNCELNPSSPSCTTGIMFCRNNPSHPSCVGNNCASNPNQSHCPGNTGFCRNNPSHPSCPNKPVACHPNVGQPCGGSVSGVCGGVLRADGLIQCDGTCSIDGYTGTDQCIICALGNRTVPNCFPGPFNITCTSDANSCGLRNRVQVRGESCPIVPVPSDSSCGVPSFGFRTVDGRYIVDKGATKTLTWDRVDNATECKIVNESNSTTMLSITQYKSDKSKIPWINYIPVGIIESAPVYFSNPYHMLCKNGNGPWVKHSLQLNLNPGYIEE